MLDAAFAAGLDEVGAFPDRVKIEALVMMAEDAAGDAHAIGALAATALDRLTAAAPDRKLSLLYVIDAVGKNKTVGVPFQEACGLRLVTVVLDAASQVRARPAARRGRGARAHNRVPAAVEPASTTSPRPRTTASACPPWPYPPTGRCVCVCV